MSVNPRNQRFAWPIVWSFLFACTSISAFGKDANDQSQVITYSAGYRIVGANAHNVVELGIITSCGQALCMKYARYDGEKNIPRVPTEYRHAMRAPFRSPKCHDELIATIIPSEAGEAKVKFNPESDGFSIETDLFNFRWRADPKLTDAYVLAEITQSDNVSRFDQVEGFAFTSHTQVIGSIKATQLAAHFNGEIYHKDTLMGVADDWKFSSSSIDFRHFTVSDTGEVLMMSQPGHPDVIKRVGKPLWVQNSIILARGQSPIAPLVQEYGHDFNMNGCFDEFGHNKLLLPIGGEANAIRAFVYIEYSPDKFDGVPMISIGRYYK